MTNVAVPAQTVGSKVRAPKTAELIAAQLRRQIVRGDLQPGQTLPAEVQLMAEFGVSRPTLREAFRILETETLISVRRGSRGGARVMSPDLSVAARFVGVLLQINGTTITDVYEARTVFEPACAGLLALRRTTQDLDDLTDIIDRLDTTVKQSPANGVPEPTEWARLTLRFHELLTERCGNFTLSVQAAVLQDIVRTHMQTRSGTYDASEPPERFRRAIRAYRRQVSLLEDKDAARAESQWRDHMVAAGKYLLKDDLKNKPVVDLFD